MKKRTNLILTVLGIFFLIVSIVMFAFPTVDEQVYKTEQKKIIEEYQKNVLIKNTKVKKSSGKKSADNKIDFKRLKRDIKQYNKKIYRERQIKLSNSTSYQTSPINLYNYGFKNNVYGYLSIDKINLQMALYLGANEYNMSLGGACLAQTSIPYGGKNTNSVIAGHCGYGCRLYFRHIENLEKGDIVKLTIPFGNIYYKVINKKIIKPNDMQSILIQDNKDLITLFTCYPYPSNSHRCCVFCERIKEKF